MEEEIPVLEEDIIRIGGGAVDSVNGKTGAVVLTATDVGAATPQSVTSAEARANAYTDTKTQAVRNAIPANVSQLGNDLNYQTETQVNAKINPVSAKADATDTAINKTVLNNVTITGNTSTDTLSLDSGKVNIKTGATSSATVPFPVASATTAGVMNAATFQGLQQTTDIANGLLNGAVAINGIAAEPTQAVLTAVWKAETGRTELMNRAVIYDIANSKLWTYYTNTSTWYPAANAGGSVEVQPWTNTQAGIVKGSTSDGQIFAENDGTGSVNGWDEVKTDIQNLEEAGYQTENDVNAIIAATNVSDLADGADYATTAEVTAGLAEKQDTISDLATIREGATAGATAVQPEDLPAIEQTTGSSTNSVMSQDATTQALNGKQNTLTAGEGISIINDVISAAGSGGGVKVLTTADYNYPANNPTTIALWLLPFGLYQFGEKSGDYPISVKYAAYENPVAKYGGTIITGKTQAGSAGRYIEFSNEVSNPSITFSRILGGSEDNKVTLAPTANNLTTTSGVYSLDARQGKVLKDLIDALDARVTALEG